MKTAEIKELCLTGAEKYYNFLASKPNGGVEEVEVTSIERVSQDTFKIRISKKLFDIESALFRQTGSSFRTFSESEVKIKLYDANKKTIFVKISQEGVQNIFATIGPKSLVLVIDLKFLVKRVIDWYAQNGDKLEFQVGKKLNRKIDPRLFFNEENFRPSKEQSKAIEVLLGNQMSYIWGAPGTGKTRFVLSYSILHYINQNQRVLVLAPTNVALEQVLGGVIEMTDKAGVERNKILRLGYPSAEFASDFGDTCEILGIEKELARIVTQINILTALLGLKTEKENTLRRCIEGFLIVLEKQRTILVFNSEITTIKERVFIKKTEIANLSKKK